MRRPTTQEEADALNFLAGTMPAEEYWRRVDPTEERSPIMTPRELCEDQAASLEDTLREGTGSLLQFSEPGEAKMHFIGEGLYLAAAVYRLAAAVERLAEKGGAS